MEIMKIIALFNPFYAKDNGIILATFHLHYLSITAIECRGDGAI